MLPALLVALSAALAALWLLRYPRYRVGHRVWAISPKREAQKGIVTDVVWDGYTIRIPELEAKCDFYISKKHSRKYLRRRSV